MQNYPDIALSPLNPFIHYILYGAKEGRLPRPANQPPVPYKKLKVTIPQN